MCTLIKKLQNSKSSAAVFLPVSKYGINHMKSSFSRSSDLHPCMPTTMLTAAVPSGNLTRLSLSFSVRYVQKALKSYFLLFINTRTGIHFPGNTYRFCCLFCSVWYSFDLQSSLLRPPDPLEFPEPSIDCIREIPTFQ